MGNTWKMHCCRNRNVCTQFSYWFREGGVAPHIFEALWYMYLLFAGSLLEQLSGPGRTADAWIKWKMPAGSLACILINKVKSHKCKTHNDKCWTINMHLGIYAHWQHEYLWGNDDTTMAAIKLCLPHFPTPPSSPSGPAPRWLIGKVLVLLLVWFNGSYAWFCVSSYFCMPPKIPAKSKQIQCLCSDWKVKRRTKEFIVFHKISHAQKTAIKLASMRVEG